MTKRKMEHGFTMIELIAVLMLIGVLAAYAIPKLYNTSDAAYKKSAQQAAAEGISLVKTAYANCLMLEGSSTGITGEKVLTQLNKDINGSTATDVITSIDLGDDYNVTFSATDQAITITGVYKGVTPNITGNPETFTVPSS